MAVQPFLLINHTERVSVVANVQKALHVWEEEWFAASARLTVVLVDGSDVREHTWKSYKTTGRASVSISMPEDWHRGATSWITGNAGVVEKDGEVAAVVMNQLLRSLAAALLGTMGDKALPIIEVEAPADHSFTAAGGVFVQCRAETGIEFRLWLSPDVVEDWVAHIGVPNAHRISLMPARQAIAERTVSVEAILGEAELTLDELQTLGIGDVIRLDRRLDEPLTVRISSAVACAGFLGTAGEQKAVQLTSIDESFNRG